MSSTPTKSFTRYLPAIARILLGLIFFVFGLIGLLNLIPPPKDGSVPQAAMDFSIAMMKTGYLFQLVKGTEILCGALLLANRFVPLALVILAPVVVNIVAFHAALMPAGLAIPLLALGLEIYLARVHREAFRPLFKAKAGGV